MLMSNWLDRCASLHVGELSPASGINISAASGPFKKNRHEAGKLRLTLILIITHARVIHSEKQTKLVSCTQALKFNVLI
jgi:hypothetical protein